MFIPQFSEKVNKFNKIEILKNIYGAASDAIDMIYSFIAETKKKVLNDNKKHTICDPQEFSAIHWCDLCISMSLNSACQLRKCQIEWK